ncbi:MAG TPA: hypothetical protein VEQ58_08360, partial [Polyangiaceae bacterium]|nr:hypothetical protein [Polyangiaceae bacterium]
MLRNADDGATLDMIDAALALLLLVALLTVRDLPLVDLPQHALQLANWMRIDAGRADVADLELNFRTPYLLAYPIARALCAMLPVLVSLKLVFWASIVLLPRALRALCRQLGHDPWLSLLGYPLALGYGFCFGFVAFCAALPLAYLAFALLASHREAPTVSSGLWLALTLALLLVAHGVALGFFLLVAAPLLLSGGGKLWQRLWPLLSAPLLGAAWLGGGRTSTRLGPDYWAFEPGRWLELPGQLVGIGSVDVWATLLGVLLLGAVCWNLGPRRALPFWAPLPLCLLGYGLFPTMFRGAGPLHPRFSCYLVPALLFAFAPRVDRARAVRRALSVLVTVGVLLLFCVRLADFQGETAGFHAVLARLPPGLAVRPIIFDRGSLAFPGTPAHLHLPAYYSLEKGGSSGYSFAMYSISVVRFKPGVRIPMGGGSE